MCEGSRQDRALEGAMTFNVTTVMGKRDEPLLEVAARQLAEALADAGCSRSAALYPESCLVPQSLGPAMCRTWLLASPPHARAAGEPCLQKSSTVPQIFGSVL